MLAALLSAALLSAAPEAPVHSPRDAFQLDAIGAFGFFPFDGGVGLWPRWTRTVWHTRRADGALVLGAYGMGRFTRLTRDPWAARAYAIDGLEQRYQLVATFGHVVRLLPSRRLELGVHVGGGGAWLTGTAEVSDPVHGWSRRVHEQAAAANAVVMLELAGYVTPNVRMGLLINATAPNAMTVTLYGWVGLTLGLRIPGPRPS